jgi:ATP-binding cassette subfamily B protein
MADQPSAKPPRNPKSLSGLLPFLAPYKWRIGMALLFLVLAAAATLAFPMALRGLVDAGMSPRRAR